MKTTMKIALPDMRIIDAKVLSDGTCEVTVDILIDKNEYENFTLIEASKLSLKDKFMQHEPKTEQEKKFKELLEEIIKKGVKDFWRPSIDPSFNEDKSGICYVSGNQPAVGKSYNWWEKIASEYNPKRGSRLGTKSEYVAFLGVLIKSLVAEGWTVAKAWDAVCNDSKRLGHYCNSKKAMHNFEPTGSREICGFFDLANTCKILAEDEDAGGFWLAGGPYFDYSFNFPLVDLYHDYFLYNGRNFSVGWLVLEKGSADR